MALSLILAAAALGAASPAERLAGTWQLDAAGSNTGSPLPSDYRLSRQIVVEGERVTQTDSFTNYDFAGEKVPSIRVSYSVRTDGRPAEVAGLNQIPVMPGKTTAAARWEGDNLVIEARGQDPLGPWSGSHRLFLSPDGQVLTEVVTASSNMGETVSRLVFRRAN